MVVSTNKPLKYVKLVSVFAIVLVSLLLKFILDYKGITLVCGIISGFLSNHL